MVAIITGSGFGLERGSGRALGERGQLGDAAFGRFGENVTLNASNGNLFITRTDEILIGRRSDNLVGRSYNSLATSDEDNQDNWRLGGQRRVNGLSGTINTAGSNIKRTDWDGSVISYAWNAASSRYLAVDSSGNKLTAGAADWLTYAGGIWTWTDGDTQLIETYDNANSGRILTSVDMDGNALTYSYTGALLVKVTTANGEFTELTWSGNNLTQVVTRRADNSIISTRVHYSYDTSNRLQTVTTDLSPEDNAITDGKVVITTYTYDGTSDRVASISQTGGARLDIVYDVNDKVASYSETTASGVTRTTSFSYDSTNRITTITDPVGQITKLTYDAVSQLKTIDLPLSAGESTTRKLNFNYSKSDVTLVTDAASRQIVYQYDSTGNRVFGNYILYLARV